jgi:hypothetical protein
MDQDAHLPELGPKTEAARILRTTVQGLPQLEAVAVLRQGQMRVPLFDLSQLPESEPIARR